MRKSFSFVALKLANYLRAMGRSCGLPLLAGLLLSIGALLHSSSVHAFGYSAEVFFATQSAELDAPEKLRLQEFVNRNASSFAPGLFVLTGHADDSERDPPHLSEMRAQAVKKYLTVLGVRPEVIFTEGKGARQPVASNSTEAGRGKNRRVEVELGDFVKSPYPRARTMGFAWLVDWFDSRIREKRSPAGLPQVDAHDAALTPLRLLKQIKDSSDKAQLLERLVLYAMYRRDDALLRSLVSQRHAKSAVDGLPPAYLYAKIYGTAYARQVVKNEETQTALDAPGRIAFAKEVWCHAQDETTEPAPTTPYLMELLKIILPHPEVLARLPADQQYEWVECAALKSPAAHAVDGLKWLRAQGVSLDAQRSDKTFLYRSLSEDALLPVTNLLAAGANPNQKDKTGNTLLHNVAKEYCFGVDLIVCSPRSLRSQRDLWNALIGAGADPRIRNSHQELPHPPLEQVTDKKR